MNDPSDLIRQQEHVSKACQSAESVLGIFERRSPGDHRPAEAIATARRWIHGSATSEDCRIAYAAAEAAAEMTLSAAESNEANGGTNSALLAYAATYAAEAAAMAAKAASMPAHAAGYASYAAASATNAAFVERRYLSK